MRQIKLPQPMQRLVADRRGSAVIELAFAAPLLIVMLLGATDGALWTVSRMSVERAARAGAEYASSQGFDESKMKSTIESSAASRSAVLSRVSAYPAPTQWCGCHTLTRTIQPAICGSICLNGLEAGTYVTANARATHKFLFGWGGDQKSSQITAQTVVRIK